MKDKIKHKSINVPNNKQANIQHPRARRIMVVGLNPTGLEALRYFIHNMKEYYPVAIISDDSINIKSVSKNHISH